MRFTTENTEAKEKVVRIGLNPLLASLCALCIPCGECLADPNSPQRIAHPAPKFTLLSAASKPPLPISLLSITADMPGKPSLVTYLDPTGAQKTIPLREIIALAPPTWVPTPESTGETSANRTSDLPVHRLDLTDSQRFVGALVPDEHDPSAPNVKSGDAPVYFHHDRLGTLAFPLDRVSRYIHSSQRAIDFGGRPLSTVSDTVLLLNTDRLEGLVTRLGPSVWIETRPLAASAPKPADAATQIDASQVTLVQLVNPPVPLRTIRVDLADGSSVAVGMLAADTAAGSIVIRPVDSPSTSSGVALELGSLAAVVPDPTRLTALGSLPISTQQPASGRFSIPSAQVLSDAEAPLAAPDILLPGPMTVEWTLTSPAASLVGYAQMDDRSFAWGDCTAVVSLVPRTGPERELARARLNADNPTLTIAADLNAVPGDKLRVRTEAGERGPIQDRVVLRRMILLGKQP